MMAKLTLVCSKFKWESLLLASHWLFFLVKISLDGYIDDVISIMCKTDQQAQFYLLSRWVHNKTIILAWKVWLMSYNLIFLIQNFQVYNTFISTLKVSAIFYCCCCCLMLLSIVLFWSHQFCTQCAIHCISSDTYFEE